MASANGPERLAEEAEPLLTPDDSEPESHPHPIPRRPTWIERPSHVYHVAKATALRVNIRLFWVFVPLGIVTGAANVHTIVVSIFNFLAIIPLSAVVSGLSDKLSDEFGDLLGALINATFGNAVELSIGILALVREDTAFAQTVMLGSILSDILFVLGGCFFSASWRKPILSLNMAVADALSSLMIISAVALILPTALYSTFEASTPLDLDKQIVNFSRGTAVVLFVLYIAYLYFQLKTHKYLFDGQPEGNTAHRGDESNAVSRQGSHQGTDHEGTQRTPVENLEQTAPTNVLTTTVALIASAAGIMLCSYFLLASIDKASEATHISRTFIATILVPIASNAPECATVIAAARSGRIDYALGVIVGSILQIALCVIPILVMLGWVLHQPMTLSFEVFQTIILFLAILLVNHLLQNGKYTYMHGLVLVGLYVVLAIAFFLRDDI